MPSLNRPTDRYKRSWITQRLINRAPEWSRARQFPYSVAQQVLNPLGLEIEETLQGLSEEKYSPFLSMTSIDMMDRVFTASLPEGISFNTTEDSDGKLLFDVPEVYATIDGTESEIFIAENNDIDLIVLGTHGKSGFDRFLLGSVAEKVTRTSKVPVLVVRDSPVED